MSNQIRTIDMEPTWETLCNLSAADVLPAKELMPACKLADKIRQAQKSGAKSITFVFGKDGAYETEIK
jgi:hypothetical protein